MTQSKEQQATIGSQAQHQLVMIDRMCSADGTVMKIKPHLVKVGATQGKTTAVTVCYPAYDRTTVWRVPSDAPVKEPSDAIMGRYSSRYGFEPGWWKH